MTPAAELLMEITSIGGRLTVMPGQQLLCEWVPREYESRLMTHKIEVICLLEISQRPKPTKKQLQQLIGTIKKAGGKFYANASRTCFASILLPDELAHLHEDLVDHATALFPLVFPARKHASGKPPRCEICPAGKGCRTVGKTIGNEQICPLCNHICRAHFPPLHFGDLFDLPVKYDFRGYCNWRNEKGELCDCPGFPVVQKPVKATKTKKTKAKATPMQLPLPVTTISR